MDALSINQTFAGLVVVAIAGNAIENVVGVQLAAADQSAYAFSVILNSPLQIALVLAPVLVLISQIFGLASLTLVFSPLLVVSLMLAVVLAGVHRLRRRVDLARGRVADRALPDHRHRVLVGVSEDVPAPRSGDGTAAANADARLRARQPEPGCYPAADGRSELAVEARGRASVRTELAPTSQRVETR